MRVSAKVDYALRALLELAAAPPGPVKGERLATAQEIPPKFLENILTELRRAEIVASQRGVDGGYRLSRGRRSRIWSSAPRHARGRRVGRT